MALPSRHDAFALVRLRRRAAPRVAALAMARQRSGAPAARLDRTLGRGPRDPSPARRLHALRHAIPRALRPDALHLERRRDRRPLLLGRARRRPRGPRLAASRRTREGPGARPRPDRFDGLSAARDRREPTRRRRRASRHGLGRPRAHPHPRLPHRLPALAARLRRAHGAARAGRPAQLVGGGLPELGRAPAPGPGSGPRDPARTMARPAAGVVRGRRRRRLRRAHGDGPARPLRGSALRVGEPVGPRILGRRGEARREDRPLGAIERFERAGLGEDDTSRVLSRLLGRLPGPDEGYARPVGCVAEDG